MKFREVIGIFIVCFVCVSIEYANALSSEEITEVTETCCSHGESLAVHGSTVQGCTKADPPEDIEPDQVDTCLTALKACCQDHLKLKDECTAGMKLASVRKCSVPKSDVGKTCCEECNFGTLTGESQGKEACGSPTEEDVSPVTALRKHAYYQCCIEAANKPTTTERPTTTTKKPTTTQKPKEKCNPASCDHICNDDTGTISCQCRDGYRLQTDNTTCKDINECAEALDDLCTAEGTVCHNTQGSYKCVPIRKRDVGNNCPPGFKKNLENQVCDDINECQLPRPPCPKYLCENTIGGFKCAGKPGKPATEAPKTPMTEPSVTSPKNDICPTGFRAGDDDECVDIDECTEHLDDCQRLSQHCINTHGSFFCQDHGSKRCTPGFKVNSATGVCEDIDECEESSEVCKRSEICINMPGAYTCKSKIDTLPKLATKTCQEGTRLRVGGSICEDIDECREGTHLCDQFQNCINTFGGHECRCKNGFELDSSGACVDVNECELKLDNCRPGSHCLNVLGSFTCTRKPSTTTTTTTTVGYDYEYYDSEEDNTTIDNETSLVPKPTTKPTPNLKPTTKPTPNLKPTGKPTTTIKPTGKPTTTIKPTGKPTTTIKPTEKPTTTIKPTGKTTTTTKPTEKPTTTVKPTSKPETDVIPPPPPLGPQPDDTFDPDNRDTNPETNPENPEPNSQSPRRTTTTIRTPYTNRPRPRPHYTRPEDPRRPRPDNTGPENPRNEDPRRPTPDNPRREDPRRRRPHNHTPENPRNEHPVTPRRPHTGSTVPVEVEKLPERPEKPDNESEFEIDNLHCLFGYVRNDKGECVDMNECNGNHHICSNLEVCRNRPGGYVCDCIPGFMRDSTGWCVVTIPANETTTTPRPRVTTSTSTTTRRPEPEVNLCENNRHNCNNLEVCRNRPGGYDCDCLPGFMRDATGWCVVTIPTPTTVRTTTAPDRDRYAPGPRRDPYVPPLICELGYEFDDRRRSCVDIDECALGKARCSPQEQCVNFDGGYRCQCDDCRTPDKPTHSEVVPAPPRDRTVITVGNQYGSRGPRYLRPTYSRLSSSGAVVGTCPWGYRLTDDRMCVDIDECSKNVSECGPQQRCENFFGGYSCSCAAGHRVVDTDRCEDINECQLGQPCPYNAKCVNTAGAFRCECGPGFTNPPGNDKACMDIDECTDNPSVCEQGCANTWGSYRCYCQKGYRIGGDNRTCEDVDECEEWQSVALRGRLCVGQCLNEPGSYRCSCPDGYRLGSDKRSCVDINECETGTATCASGGEEVCQNTRGGYHCHRIRCPQGYRLEANHRCSRIQRSCPVSDWGCIQQPSAYTYNFITIVSHVYLPEGSVDLFTMHGPSWQDAVINFELRMVDVQASPGVQPAHLACFDMRPSNNVCVISLLCSLQGPQTAELELTMALRRRGQLAGTAAARLVVIVSQYEY